MDTRWAAIVLLLVLTTAMSCTQKVVQSQSDTVTPATQTAAVNSGETKPTPEVKPRTADGAAAFVGQNIHFAFDSSELSPEARQLLNAKADYLRSNTTVKFTVQGHCDERGTAAYNMALGERRADIVKKYLVSQGVTTERMKTVSFGEERPLDSSRSEAAWAKNRRAQFTVN
jgi:peptidoglycan-associated lipoprotein